MSNNITLKGSESVWITPYIASYDIEAEILSGLSITNDTSRLASVSGLIIWHEEFPEHFADAKAIRTVSRFGAGYDNIDIDYCIASGISVYTVPDYGIDEVSNTALAMILGRARGVFEYAEIALHIDDGSWESNIIPGLRRFSSVRVGIIGLGRIGKSLALKLVSLGFAVYFYDPYVEVGIEKVLRLNRLHSLSELYAVCSIISLNCPLNEDTVNLVDFDHVSRCSSTPIMFVNTARGGIAPDLEDIIKSIESGKIYSYDSDVFSSEPVSSQVLSIIRSSAFLRSRITITPHVAFYSAQSFAEMRSKAALNLISGLACDDASPYRIA